MADTSPAASATPDPSRPKERARAWQRMLSGRRLDLLDPSPLDIEIEDIAHGLARVARWNGQTLGDHAFTVAQHSLEVEAICGEWEPGLDPAFRLAALLHDGPEYVVGDLISPFKAAVGLDYKAFENRLLEAIHRRFSVPVALPKKVTQLIKKADRASAYFEATQLAGFSAEEAEKFFGKPALKGRPIGRTLSPWPAAEAQKTFLSRFYALCEKV